MKQVIETQLFDNSGETDSGPLDVQIEYGEGTIDIRPKGYGDACSKNGYGTPILIEFWNGELRVVVWGNINQEDPTHTINVEGAKESARRYCDKCGQLLELHNGDGSCVEDGK